MAGENLWKIRLPESEGGHEYTLARSDIRVGVLRQFKQWFGPQYGKFLTFVQLLMEGDADAWCCALWLCQKNAGEKPKSPQFMDFSVGDVMLSGNDEEDADVDGDEDPTTSEDSSENDRTESPILD